MAEPGVLNRRSVFGELGFAFFIITNFPAVRAISIQDVNFFLYSKNLSLIALAEWAVHANLASEPISLISSSSLAYDTLLYVVWFSIFQTNDHLHLAPTALNPIDPFNLIFAINVSRDSSILCQLMTELQKKGKESQLLKI